MRQLPGLAQKRRQGLKREVKVGKLILGGGNPVRIQSMTNTDTVDVPATLAQMAALEAAGCEIIRVAAYNIAAARAIAQLKKGTGMPIVADVHFDYRIALEAIEAGADKIRINPGNIGSQQKIRCVADAAKERGIPIRVGANTGSLASQYRGRERSDALVESALANVRILEKCGFYDIVIALKASDVPSTVAAYEKMNTLTDYPLHLGVTEAGGLKSSCIKSAMGIGALLLQGIGDTLRVSITGDPVLEVGVAKDILRYAGKRSFGPEIISCPTCARTKVGLERLVGEVERLVAGIEKPLKIAVMGCAVNGPGEARDADIGIAGGEGEGLIFIKGRPVKKVPEERLLVEFEKMLKEVFSIAF